MKRKRNGNERILKDSGTQSVSKENALLVSFALYAVPNHFYELRSKYFSANILALSLARFRHIVH